MVADPQSQMREDAPPQSARRFAVMLYCARSGSTFFAHRLAQSDPRVAMLPEFRLPVLLFWKGDEKVRSLDADALLDVIRDDVQFSNLAIPEDQWHDLARRLAGRSTREILESIVDVHLRLKGRAEAEEVVLKNASFAHNAEAVRAVFPEIRGVHVMRDPRGAASSMLRTPSPYDDGYPQAHGDIVHAARLWSGYVDLVASLDWPVIEVRYETLLEAPEARAADVARWLLGGAAPAEDTSGNEVTGPAGADAAEFEVGAAELRIHSLISQDGLQERATAWDSELEPWQRLAVEAIAGERMTRLGYAFSSGGDAPPALSMRARLTSLKNQTRHYGRSAGRLLWWAATDPRTARIRLRQFIARIRGRY
ncbi:MAG: sulfotransferase [Pseudomonadota bacterium]